MKTSLNGLFGHLRDAAKVHGISIMQLAALSSLADGPLKMADIAFAMGHTTAAATGLVDRLEEAALVARFHSQSDRRVVRVQLTDKGREVLSGLMAKFQENRPEGAVAVAA